MNNKANHKVSGKVRSKMPIYMLVGLLGYVLFAGSVMLFYKDDPSGMDLNERQTFNLKYLASLSLISPPEKSTVIDYLGPPDITEAKQVNDDIIQVMFYRTRKIKGDGITTKDECSPLLFRNGLLIAMGDNTYTKYLSY